MPPASSEHHSTDNQTALIGVDWGTSSLRAYRLKADGQILESTEGNKGILQVKDGAFAETLSATIGAWRAHETPVVLSGMIGSRQGWIEVPYLDVPAELNDIANALVGHPNDPALHFVPGLARDPAGQAPDVMRGEETQIIGAISDGTGRHLLIMPGTHSKWVLVDGRRITWFATFMTGELFSVLKDHSILGRLMAKDGAQHDADGRHDAEAFNQGLLAAETLPGGLLQRLFSARTLGLFERVPEAGIADYLSGLLIGSELNEALSNLEGPSHQLSVTIIGASSLADRYLDAIAHAGLSAERADDTAAARGHFLIAKEAKLIL
ncbi:MAG: 2-dehydro-3-deoxygalactonokinase [Geminicoccaceae bacterium]